MANYNLYLARAVVHGTQGQGSDLVNVFNWVIYDNTTVPPEPASILDKVKTELTAMWQTCQSSIPGAAKWLFADVSLKGPTDEDFLLLGQITLNLNGSDVSDPLPSGVSPTCTARTNFKRRRARKFLPAFGETYSALQQWTALALTRLTDFAARWIVGFYIPGFDTFFYPIALHVADFAWSFLVGVRANATPGYQRRRKPGVGA